MISWSIRDIPRGCTPLGRGRLARAGGLAGDAREPARRSSQHAGLWRGPVEALTPAALNGAELVVDAIFDAGLSRPLEGRAAQTLAAAAARKLTIIAVDVLACMVLGCWPKICQIVCPPSFAIRPGLRGRA